MILSVQALAGFAAETLEFGSDLRTVLLAILILKQKSLFSICKPSEIGFVDVQTHISLQIILSRLLLQRAWIFLFLFPVPVGPGTTSKSSGDSYAPGASLTRKRKCWV